MSLQEPERERKLGRRIQEFFQFLERGEFKVGPSRELVLVQSLKLLDGLGVELSKMNWKFADLDSKDADLILGDHPVISECIDTVRWEYTKGSVKNGAKLREV